MIGFGALLIFQLLDHLRSMMMNAIFVAEDRRTFLGKFFYTLAENPKVSPLERFNSTFQEPPLGLENLAHEIEPAGPFKLVFVDGQSRAGKTWCTIETICNLMDNGRVDKVLSSGEDSHRVFGGSGLGAKINLGPCKDLACGFELLARELNDQIERGLSGRIVLLLDDFLGTIRPRTLAYSERRRESLSQYLSADWSRNPLALAVAGRGIELSVVITTRSVVLITFGLLIGAEDLVGLEKPRGRRSARGVFEDINGFIGGPNEADWYRKIAEAHVALRRIEPRLRFPPLAAFSPEVLTGFSPEVSERTVKSAPKEFFGLDLDCLASELERTLERLDDSETSDLTREMEQIVNGLEEAYLIYLAPGLIFPDYSVDHAFLKGDRAKALRKMLYIQPDHDGGAVLRVPNRFYLEAVSEHLADPRKRELAAGVLRRRSQSYEKKNLAVLIRGLLEHALDSANRRPRVPLDRSTMQENEPTLRELVEATSDRFLEWELSLLDNEPLEIDVSDLMRRPGLASAVGWAAFKFREVMKQRNADGMTIAHRLFYAIGREVKRLVSEGSEHGSQSELITVSYSNLLRWVVLMEAEPEPDGYLALLTNPLEETPQHSATGSDTSLTDKLQMVLEDALIWADTVRDPDGAGHQIKNLASAKSLARVLEQETQGSVHPHLWCTANRAFSLSWHNEWMERPGFLREPLERWASTHIDAVLEVLGQAPDLVGQNLAYHWAHMITQWSVWTRDWCYSRDNIKYERGRDIGCRNAGNNALLGNILMGVLESRIPSEEQNRARNALFLLGTRCATLPLDSSRITTALMEIEKGELLDEVLQAVLELARQGFLNEPHLGEARDEEEREGGNIPNQLQTVLRNLWFENEARWNSVWTAYRRDLESVTYLDLLPGCWEEIMPEQSPRSGPASKDAIASQGARVAASE
jgi:hypothetical protein